MVDACRIDHSLGVDGITTLQHLVDTIAIHIGYSQLVELCRPRCLVVATPSIIMVEIGWLAIHPVETEGEDIIVVSWGWRFVTLAVKHSIKSEGWMPSS